MLLNNLNYIITDYFKKSIIMKRIKREKEEMGVICCVCGAMFGGLVGTVTMCLVQMGSRSEGNKKDLSD